MSSVNKTKENSQSPEYKAEFAEKMQRIESFLRLVDEVGPELAQLKSTSYESLNSRERKTLSHILNLLDQAAFKRAQFQRIIEEWKRLQPDDTGSLPEAKEGKSEPQLRLKNLRQAIEYKYARSVPKALLTRIRNWEHDLRESAARSLSDEIEGAFRLLLEQKEEWDRKCVGAEFGSPGLTTRLKSLFRYFKTKTLQQEIEADRLRLESVKSQCRKHQDGCRFLANAVLCHFKIFDNRDSSMMKRFEKVTRLECEREIGQGILNRGQSLFQQGRSEYELLNQKSRYCVEAAQFVRSRALTQLEMRRLYERQKLTSPVAALERTLHSGLLFLTADFADELDKRRERLEFLKLEYQTQREQLLRLLAPVGRYLELDNEGDTFSEDSYEAFVALAKEAQQRV